MALQRLFDAALRQVARRLPAELSREILFWGAERWRLRWDPYYREPKPAWRDFFRRAFTLLRFNGIDGDYAEFGCAGARTFTLAWREARRAGHGCRLWAFDSFQGLPEPAGPEDAHPVWVAGAMKTTLARFRAILDRYGVPPEEYEIVPGFYEESLAGGSRLPDNLCLAYIDCDLYSSTRTVLRFLEPRLKHGMILAFDDYYCYSATQPSGERRACSEILGRHPRWRLVPYVQYGWHGMSFVVERRDFGIDTGALF